MKPLLAALALWFPVSLVSHAADPAGEMLVLNEKRLRLARTDAPEWEAFAHDPPAARRLDLRFNARSNIHEATLFIRQDDVRLEWWVELNGGRLGKLFLMEADLVHHLAVPPG